MNWIISSIIAIVAFSVMIVIMRKILDLGMSIVVLNFLLVMAVGLVFGGMALYSKKSFSFPTTVWILLLVAIIASAIGNFYQVQAFAQAPNPGYALGLISTQAILITIGAFLFLGLPFSWIKVAGIVVVLSGAYLLVI